MFPMVHLTDCGRPLLTKELGCSFKASLFCTVMPSPALATGFPTAYSATALRSCITLPTTLISHPRISIYGSLNKHLAGKWFATDASEKQAVSSCIHQSLGWRIFPVWLTEGQKVKTHPASMLDLNQWIECVLKPSLMTWVQCLMCNICQIAPKVELFMVTLEVAQKCHFQILTVTVNYPLNQEC